MSNMKLLLSAAAIGLVSLSPLRAVQQPPDRGDTPGLGWGNGGSNGSQSLAVPGPVAGVGLPILVVAGGYVWVRRRIRRGKEQNGTD
jgi:hypothetical protein